MTAHDAEHLRHGAHVYVVIPPEADSPPCVAPARVEGKPVFLIPTAPFVSLILRSGRRIVSADRVFTDARFALAAAHGVTVPGA